MRRFQAFSRQISNKEKELFSVIFFNDTLVRQKPLFCKKKREILRNIIICNALYFNEL